MAEFEIPHGEGKQGEKQVGILIAIIAVLMSIVSALGHNAANDLIVNEVKSSNGFAHYQAKRQREYVNEIEIRRIEVELAGTPTPAQGEILRRLSSDLRQKNEVYKKEGAELQAEAKKLGEEAKISGERNEKFDHSEILLQVAVVLCSLTLLTESRMFLRIGVVVAIAGIVVGALAFVPPHGHPAATPAAAASSH
jgi:hypothetical protein